jgi:hypothetical protein
MDHDADASPEQVARTVFFVILAASLAFISGVILLIR